MISWLGKRFYSVAYVVQSTQEPTFKAISPFFTYGLFKNLTQHSILQRWSYLCHSLIAPSLHHGLYSPTLWHLSLVMWQLPSLLLVVLDPSYLIAIHIGKPWGLSSRPYLLRAELISWGVSLWPWCMEKAHSPVIAWDGALVPFPRGPDIQGKNTVPSLKPGTCLAKSVLAWGQGLGGAMASDLELSTLRLPVPRLLCSQSVMFLRHLVFPLCSIVGFSVHSWPHCVIISAYSAPFLLWK